MLFCLHWKNMKGLHACKWKCYDCVFLCLGLITQSRKRFLARPWWYLVQWTLKMNSKLNLIFWLRKLQIKWATKLRYHVLFTTQHTGLHNQIVQDGISSLANNLKVKDETFKWEWSKENLRVPFSNKDLFWNSKCYVMIACVADALNLLYIASAN